MRLQWPDKIVAAGFRVFFPVCSIALEHPLGWEGGCLGLEERREVGGDLGGKWLGK